MSYGPANPMNPFIVISAIYINKSEKGKEEEGI